MLTVAIPQFHPERARRFERVKVWVRKLEQQRVNPIVDVVLGIAVLAQPLVQAL